MTEPVIMTRQCRETELEGRGVSGKAMECLLAETAQERHLSRVAYARWAAEEYYLSSAKLDRDEVTEDTLSLMAGAILWADVIGVGGRDGVEGAATTRHPALSGCGKGRKQASDGGAWSAAIHRAALDCAGWFRINDNGVLVYSRARRTRRWWMRQPPPSRGCTRFSARGCVGLLVCGSAGIPAFHSMPRPNRSRRGQSSTTRWPDP